MKNIDQIISKKLYDWGQPMFPFWSFVSRYGFYLVLILVILTNLPLPSGVVYGLVPSITPLLIAIFIQEIVQRPRPSFGSGYKQFALRWSFPSGHATAAFAVATASIHAEQPIVSAVLFVSAFLIAISRIFVGVHFLGDVIAGALLGSVVSATLIWL